MAPKVSLEVWTLQLRKDCERQDKLIAFNALDDYVISLLWERGLDPTVNAIVESTRYVESRVEPASLSSSERV
jgi:hypothetical protein